jgi:hypothetical protein
MTATRDDGDPSKPGGRVELLGRILSDQRLAFPVGPREAVDLAFLHLVF